MGSTPQQCTIIINLFQSKESSVEDLPTSQPGIESIEGGTGDAGFPPEDCNQNVVSFTKMYQRFLFVCLPVY